jgi:hypothetical protein
LSERLEEFVRKGMAAQAAIDELAKRAAEGPAIHHLHGGVTPCGMPGVPSDWPEGHRWSDWWGDVTCLQCMFIGVPLALAEAKAR